MSERLDDRAFELLCAAVAATLAAHLGHLPVWLWLPLLVILPLRAWTRRHGAKKTGVWIRLPLTALLLVLVLVNFGNVFGREPGSVLGCGLLGLKLLEVERVRDARVALGFAAFVLMSALLFTQTLLFSAAIGCVLVLQVAAIAALQPAPLPQRRSLRAQITFGALLLAAGLPLAAASFVLVPRLGAPLWGAPGNDAAARTGLSDSMAPGDLTNLLIDDSPAFRVEFDATAPSPQQRYFRTLVLWDFDGTTWTRARMPGPAEQAQAQAALLGYTVTLEPTNQPWLPALDLPWSVAEDGLRIGTDHAVVATTPVTQPRHYRVQSATRYTLAATLGAAQRRRALALPEGFDPKTHALAERWRAEGRDDAAIVQGALDLFHASFTYTLSPPALGRDSIDDFLFGTQKGFCEHYASAFVVLMRAAGIPARVVTGYQGGWWNASGNYLLVRQSDAHAWAETWMPERGWQRVDPTAAVSPSRIELGAAVANGNPGWEQADWLRALRNQLDFANRLWTESIIRFDLAATEKHVDAVRHQRCESGRSVARAVCRAGCRDAVGDALGDAQRPARARRCARSRLVADQTSPRRPWSWRARERRPARLAAAPARQRAGTCRAAGAAGRRLCRLALRRRRTRSASCRRLRRRGPALAPAKSCKEAAMTQRRRIQRRPCSMRWLLPALVPTIDCSRNS